MAKKHLSWEEFDQLMEDIYQHYRGQKITKIIGITRGGLIPAVKLSHRLNIPMDTLCWQSKDGENNKQLYKIIKMAVEEDMETILFIDDICDSGLTIEEISEFAQNIRFTTLLTKTQLPEFSPKIIGDEWVVFPWEK